MNAPRVAVVGAGIAGLAAAHRLRALLGPEAAITLLEQRDRIGGVLRTVDLAGSAYDVGAEAFLARRPEVQALLAELGLVDRLVHPTGAGASIRAAGRTVALPGGTVLGVPTSGARLAGLLSHAGLTAAAAEPARPLAWSPGGDAALGPLLGARFGDELTDRLVRPAPRRARVPRSRRTADRGGHAGPAACHCADPGYGFSSPRLRAAGLFQLAHTGQLTGVQAVVALTVMTLFVPCIAGILSSWSGERGLKTGFAIIGVITPIAIFTGAGLNYVLHALGVQF